MATKVRYTQANRALAVTTPLGTDALLLESLTGTEGLSEPFLFRLELLSEGIDPISFEKVLGQKVAVRLGFENANPRWLHGIVSRLTEGRLLSGAEADTTFIRYTAEVVPQFALLRHRVQSRIFQQQSVPDILKDVLTGLEVSFQIQGTFQPRDYCVQYRESDFDFASRLMEEEGIYYYFKHSQQGHKMVVANSTEAHADIRAGGSKLVYEDSSHDSKLPERVTAWEKTQEIRAAKYTLRDHCFERPDDNLEAVRPTAESVQVGTVQHKLKSAVNESFEVYEYPGGYAARFDGVDPGGGDRAADVKKITPDGERTAALRTQREAVAALVIAGAADCRHFSAGHKFTLDKHSTANGSYVLTRVDHDAGLEGTYASHQQRALSYKNSFRCLPAALRFVPPRVTPRARVEGPQTAVVVGPPKEEIFTDKYGRVKVKFFWDRSTKTDGNNSCWIRVATTWAGQQWGAVHLPRVGQEVVVAFEEGNPDQPLVVGSVYNAAQMPPFKLPGLKTQSGLRTRSSLQGTADNCNELRFEDKKGSEDVFFHAEKDFHREVENDDSLKVGHDQTIEVKHDRTETVSEGNETVTIKKGERKVTVETGGDTHDVKGDRKVIVQTGNDSHQIKTGNRSVQIEMGSDTLTIKMGNQTTKLDLGKSTTEAMTGIELKVGPNSIKLDPSGVTIQGLTLKLQGQVTADLKAPITNVNADGILTLKGGITMIN
jgi:type VI secretion system secreted protein VgrG